MSENILRQICKAQHLVDSKQYKPARKICLKLLKHPQGKADANFLLGVMLLARQDHHAACKKFRQTLQQLPEHAGARINLLACYRELGQLDAMLALARQFHQQPLSPIETFGAYRAYLETCHWHEADTLRDNVVAALKQGAIPAEIMSGTLIHMNETPDISRDDLFQIHRQWGKMVTEAGAASTCPFPRPAPPHNKIKIAYLSVDFNKHPVGYFARPVILGHNRDRFEVFCYAHILKDDETTATFRQAADHFIDISALTAPQAAARIARDGIHILVDLSGHTANSPLPIMAYQPAPVQISYLGYPNTTGLDTVDFRISDEYCEAGGGTLYTEQLLNMPSTFLCLLGMPDVPHSETTPAEHNGFITFGSFNHIRKINPQVIHTWARIMQQVEHSRMLIKSKGCDQDMITNNILQEFERHNIARDRIRFAAYSDLYKDHAALFDQVDITLDTFPYHGTHTTCDALWMSLPVVTLAGDTHVQRVSASILKCIGFDATIASTEDEYIEKAVSLASQPEKLSILRQCTHTLFKNSLILNPAKVIAQLEEQYLKAWAIKMGQPAFIEVQPALTELTMNHDIAILTPRDLKEISTYALTEQGDWYEDELRFLRHIAKPGMRVLDCSAEYGCYSLSLAKEVGADGAVLALNHAPNKQQAIAESARKNTFGQLHTGSSNDASSFLQTGADIIIHAENGIDSNSILFALPDALSPIVMIKAMDEHGMDEALITRMQQQGFAPYRLIPSLHLLVPVPPEFTPLSWHRQVFFCKQDRAEALASEGFLLLHELESIDLPDDLSYWQHAIEGRSFAKVLLPLWIEQVQTGQAADDWEQVRNALSAYAMAHNQESSSQQRYACLSAALNILLNTEQLQSSIARLCTLARIASELGNYTTAIQAAQMVHEGIITLEMFSPDEPFLPIAGSYDQDDYQNELTEWILAQSLTQPALIMNPTSFPIRYDELKRINTELVNLGFPNTELKLREKLSRKKDQGKFINTLELSADRPMFSIIIPTRERHDTLKSAIESALNQQDFEDYEIIVMDNFSSKKTHDVVLAFDDQKIKYYRSPQALAMNENWELALNHSKGEYIFFLGDDDAIMPDALIIANQLITHSKCDIITWDKPTYWWPNAIVPHHKNRLYVPLRYSGVSIVDSREMLEKFLQCQISYEQLPGVYSSFISKTIINKIKKIHGRYFVSPTPDLSSSIINAYFSNSYCYSQRGLSISGNSKHSGGCAFLWPHLSDQEQINKDKKIYVEYLKNGQKNRINYANYSSPKLIDSNNLAIAFANDFMFNKELFFPDDNNIDIHVDCIIKAAISGINTIPEHYDQTILDLQKIALINNLSIDFSKVPKKQITAHTPMQGIIGNTLNESSLAINCEQASITSAAAAVKHIQAIWPNYKNWLGNVLNQKLI